MQELKENTCREYSLLQDVDLQTKIYLWFMHYGALPHFFLAVQDLLNSVFPEEQVGQSGPRTWPAPSPDVNCLHFYLRGHLKSLFIQQMSMMSRTCNK
jgi:hypothetical protein